MKNEKNYTVKKSHKGGYNYKLTGVEIYLEYDAEQTNGMVSGGYGMWKPYPIFNGEVLWNNPLSDGCLWCDRKKHFVDHLTKYPEAIVEDYNECIKEHEAFLDRTRPVFTSEEIAAIDKECSNPHYKS